MTMVRSYAGVFLSNQLRNPLRGPTKPPNLTIRPLLLPKIRASSAIAVETNTDPILNGNSNDSMDVLACPICYDQLIWKGDPVASRASASRSKFQCRICKKAYVSDEAYLDLTITGSKEYNVFDPSATEFFRSPLVSFLYERGWRQNFVWGGFPGPEKEYLQPTVGGTIVDASCGSGLFSRIFAKSGMFSLVVALDFSEEMLRQCFEFIKQDDTPKENLILVRADISRLPFVSSSVDAVHAGAALHCWPSPSSAVSISFFKASVAEISRILKPGGVFVATTFILDGIFSILPIMRTLRQNVAQYSGNHFFLSEGELEDLCNSCGLEGFTYVRNGPFIMLSAMKPS
ncbi:uncharacterized methyltransferase At1g78140, chloroplastic isoform X2 [Magnolia sinica]|uniref:uncharacterized methyltransferase At1g78140, chloroplastic isoform X2 n=1 Tax=Magnolia sinica TaxID=86752 RepID=UPI0026586C9D|nr:uncharacterized methyltransferase At1g78140, chloroplastic isoform X2 [Magnolia sinica]